VPFSGGKPGTRGVHDGFTGKASIMNPRDAGYRPGGLALAPTDRST
jgi:hypothetical protein